MTLLGVTRNLCDGDDTTARERAAAKAQDLCEDGPLLSKPYDHSLLLNRIKSEVAARARNGKPESDI